MFNRRSFRDSADRVEHAAASAETRIDPRSPASVRRKARDLKPNRPLVLVVEDDRLTREMSSESIRAAGMRVVQCESGDSALELLAAQRPDLVLLDLAMPGLSGLETLREIRRERALRDVPVVVVTGHGDLPTIQAAYQAGATDFVIKPVVHPILVARIRYILKSSAAFEKLDSARRALEDAQRLLRSGSWEWEARRGRLWVSESLRSMLSIAEELHTPMRLADLARWVHPEERSSAASRFQGCFDNGDEVLLDHRLVTTEGEVLHVRQQVARLVDDAGGVLGLQGVILDRTPEERAFRQADLFAHYDAETGLPNRRLLLERLDRAIDAAVLAGHRVAVVCLELERATSLRSALDESAHRALLRAIAERLSNAARDPSIAAAAGRRPRTWVAHARETRFAIVLSSFHESGDAIELAERMREALDEPFELDAPGGFVGSPVSAGIAFSPGDGIRPGDLLRAAETALDAERSKGSAGLTAANPQRIAAIEKGLIEEASLYRAFRSGRVTAGFAPIASLSSGRRVGLMARAFAASEGSGAPVAIDSEIARRSGWAKALARWLVPEACARSRDWPAAVRESIRLCVDVPTSCLRRREFPACLEAVLKQSAREPGTLEIGLGDLAGAAIDSELVAAIEAVRTIGVRIALSGFGPDPNGLGRMALLPFDALRIDGAALAPFVESHRGAPEWIAALVAFGHAQDALVVAMGVGSVRALRVFRDCGVDQIEGPVLGAHVDPSRVPECLDRDLLAGAGEPSGSIEAEED